MIITLKGKVIANKATYAVIDVGGLGHQVFMSPATLSTVTVGEIIGIWTHEHIREDSRDLYGFRNEREHALFTRLLGVSGVGPKMALNFLGLGPVDDIERFIEAGDADWLSRVPGVGKKTAQKIILELKGKLADVGEGNREDEELLVALTNLGYSRDTARTAVATTSGNASVETRLRDALKHLSSH
jgi:Holliday junction DNA helicase RuvA